MLLCGSTSDKLYSNRHHFTAFAEISENLSFVILSDSQSFGKKVKSDPTLWYRGDQTENEEQEE